MSTPATSRPYDTGYDSGYGSGYDGYSDDPGTGNPGLVDPIEPGLADPSEADPGYYQEDTGVVDPGYKSPYEDEEPGIINYEDLYQSTEAGESGW